MSDPKTIEDAALRLALYLQIPGEEDEFDDFIRIVLNAFREQERELAHVRPVVEAARALVEEYDHSFGFWSSAHDALATRVAALPDTTES